MLCLTEVILCVLIKFCRVGPGRYNPESKSTRVLPGPVVVVLRVRLGWGMWLQQVGYSLVSSSFSLAWLKVLIRPKDLHGHLRFVK